MAILDRDRLEKELEWKKLINLKNELVIKKFNVGLNQTEQEKLDSLRKEADDLDDYLHGDHLKELEKRLEKLEKVVSTLSWLQGLEEVKFYMVKKKDIESLDMKG